MEITTGKAAEITGGRLYGPDNIVIKELVTDSRLTVVQEGSAFFAIKGPNHDGHRFTEQLYRQGLRVFFVENMPDNLPEYKEAAFIKVENTVVALQSLASEKRKHFGGKVIAVTGSAGKTVVKEWLADVIGLKEPVVRSPKSYNSQIGVPLSVWKLENNYKTGIIEAGISKPGEMDNLVRIIQPHTGIITNIGDAHSENFPGQKEKASEKLKLFSTVSVIVYCGDHEIIKDIIHNDKNLSAKRLVEWSLKDKSSTVFIEKTRETGAATEVRVFFRDYSFGVVIPFTDRASVENALTVIAAALAHGIEPEMISRGIAGLVSVAMRMEKKAGISNSVLIEDYYNSDPGSLKMALEYLKSQNNRRSVLILSDFLQTGRNERELYGEVAGLVRAMKIDRLICIGNALFRNKDLFPDGSSFYATTQDFCRDIDLSCFSGDAILLKGARSFEFERISNLLSQRVHQTVLEINMDAVSHNISKIRRRIKPGTRIMAMVKAFAYGAGAADIALLMEFHRVDYLAVAYADEGVELREAGVSLPVVVMNPEPDAFDLMIKYNLEPEIYSLVLLKKFIQAGQRHGLTDYPVHIKIDTGMHRLGFLPQETDEMMNQLKSSGCLRIASVFSHLAASENPALDEFTHRQALLLKEIAGRIRLMAGYGFLVHLLNTTGIIRFPEYQFDMVRPGIGIYGIAGTPGINLRQAARMKTIILQVKTIPAGEPIGYGCADVSDKERRIAVLPVGYADGLDRRLGNGKGKFYVKDHFVPVVGNICMDSCMADVTGTDAAEGDEVEIFGEHISVEELARLTDTIPYEILTSVPPRVKRVFYRE